VAGRPRTKLHLRHRDRVYGRYTLPPLSTSTVSRSPLSPVPSPVASMAVPATTADAVSNAPGSRLVLSVAPSGTSGGAAERRSPHHGGSARAHAPAGRGPRML
jgi:hypothetical protein